MFIEENHFLHEAVPFLNCHEEVFLSRVPPPFVRIKSANPHAWLPTGHDVIELVLIFFRLKEGTSHACFDVHFALAAIRLQNNKFDK